MRGTVLIAEDDALFRDVLVDSLSDEFDVTTVASLSELRGVHQRFDAVLMDDHLGDGWTTDHLGAIRDATGGARIVLCTAGVRTESADMAIQHGIQSFLVKPVTVAEVRLGLQRAVEASRLATLMRAVAADDAKDDDSLPAELQGAFQRAAKSQVCVLLEGETGVGKTHLARQIHVWSTRHARPFVHLNCAAIPESLADVELFGAERGAYTGAVQARAGSFELASGGTLFLDEIGELSLALQAKILTVLEERHLRRVGGTALRPIDVRLVVATNRDLNDQVRRGLFREDLLYRINVFPLRVPSLRETSGRLAVLIAALLRRIASGPVDLAPGELERLQAHTWPGNVRELRNVLERSVILDPPSRLTPSRYLFSKPSQAAPESLTRLTLREVEVRHMREVLTRHNGNKMAASRELDISVATLRRRLEEP